VDSPESRPLLQQPWLFTRQGLGLMALITAIAATFLANDVAYLAASVLVIGLLSRAWAALAFTRVNYTRRTLQRRAFAGDELTLESEVSNPRPLPLAWVEVWEQIPHALEPEGWKERSYAQPDSVWVERGIALWPYQRLRWRRRLRCNRRGVYQLGEARLRTGDPFGFFERERAWNDRLEVLVYPRVVPLRQLGLPLHHPSIDAVSPRSIVSDPTRTATVRDYRPDDPLRLIHWPTTARRSALQVRVLEPATSLHVSLVLDVRGFAFGIYRGELLEAAVSALASMAVFLQSKGAPVALLANTNPPIVVPPGASVAHLQQVLESLARLEPSASAPPLTASWARAEVPASNSVVLACSEMTSDLDRSLAELTSAGASVLLLLAATRAFGPSARVPTLRLTPGCDLAAVLEGRGRA
jgi:uncharacterized protein (DUF58 family)